MPASQDLGLDALCSWERRARFSVGAGCPSFGGQRTVGGHLGPPPAKLVKKLKFGRYVTVQQCLLSRPKLGVEAATGSVLPSRRAGQTETAVVPALHSQAPASRVASSVSSGPRLLCTASPSRLVHLGCLTPPSRGRPASGPPLTSNVRQIRNAFASFPSLVAIEVAFAAGIHVEAFGNPRTAKRHSSAAYLHETLCRSSVGLLGHSG
jgi:hypothetical protein